VVALGSRQERTSGRWLIRIEWGDKPSFDKLVEMETQLYRRLLGCWGRATLRPKNYAVQSPAWKYCRYYNDHALNIS
jgi:hypothetical protein